MTIKVAVIYYSATGTVHALAQAVTEGATSTGAEVRLRRVAELAPDSAIDQNPLWRRHADAATAIAQASVEDLAWADAYAFGTPTRFGAPAAQLKQFIDQAGGLWHEGKLADKPVTAFTSAYNRHGGSEATLLSLANVFYHWGALIIPPGYTDQVVYAAGGNPYGTSFVTSSAEDGKDQILRRSTRPGTRDGGWPSSRSGCWRAAGSSTPTGMAMEPWPKEPPRPRERDGSRAPSGAGWRSGWRGCQQREHVIATVALSSARLGLLLHSQVGLPPIGPP